MAARAKPIGNDNAAYVGAIEKRHPGEQFHGVANARGDGHPHKEALQQPSGSSASDTPNPGQFDGARYAPGASVIG